MVKLDVCGEDRDRTKMSPVHQQNSATKLVDLCEKLVESFTEHA